MYGICFCVVGSNFVFGNSSSKNSIVGSVDSTVKFPFEVGAPGGFDIDELAVGGKVLKKKHWRYDKKWGWLYFKKSPKGQDIELIDKVKKVRPGKRAQWECSKYWYDVCLAKRQ